MAPFTTRRRGRCRRTAKRAATRSVFEFEGQAEPVARAAVPARLGLDAHARQKILFLELGVGRMTPAFIQEPFWALTAQLPQAGYIAVNNRTQFLPRAIEDRGLAVRADIADVLADVRKTLGK